MATMNLIQDKIVEKDFFDQFILKNDYDVFDERGYQRILFEFYKLVEFRPGMKVLDLGCGTGGFTKKFLGKGLDLYGMDISPKCIEFAQKKHPEIHFCTGDIEQTPYKENSFDVVLLSGVLHHFPDFSGALKESYRILKKGGALLAFDPHLHNPMMWLYRCKKSPFYSSKGVTENEEPLAKKKIQYHFSNENFVQSSVYSISGVTYQYVDSKLAQIFLHCYNGVELLFDLPFLRQIIGSFLITYAQK